MRAIEPSSDLANPTKVKNTYRPEIDGLRAVALLPVVLFHAGLGVFSGGFVGVDIFFVISGYLITGILTSELDTGHFSITKFYERRARRILPALFVVILACIPFASWWMLPSQFKNFSQSVAAVMVFASNVLFWSQEGYFAAAADLKPLLHTWTLAVEEQFYVVFPVLLCFAWRAGRRKVFSIFAVLALVSLALSEYGWRNAPDANFYLAPTRAWELLAGSLCAMAPQARRVVADNLLSALGLALIAFSILYFDEATPFPSLYALLPVVGTSLIILFARSETFAAKLLSTAPLVGLGLISYSAYLWHQPLFAFARIRSTAEPGGALMASLCLASLVLAYFTWKFVEVPARRGSWFVALDRRKLLGASVAACACFLVFGVAADHFAAPESLTRESTDGECNYDKRDCFHVAGAGVNVALWGDSFADAFAQSLGRTLNERGVNLTLFVLHSCPSLIGVLRNEDDRLGPNQKAECTEHNRAALTRIVQQQFDVVVLTSAYQWYATALNGKGEPIIVPTSRASNPEGTVMSRSLANTVQELTASGAHVVVVTPHPRVDAFQSKRMAYHFGDLEQIYADYDGARRVRDDIVAQLVASGEKFREVSGLDLFCQGTACPVVNSQGDFMLFDGSHISTNVTGRLAAMVADAVADLSAANIGLRR